MTAKSKPRAAHKPVPTPADFTPEQMPTAMEIATLAIPLIQGDKQDPRSYTGAVIGAMFLWLEAYGKLPTIRDALYRRHAIARLSAELPHLVHDWPKDDAGNSLVVPYQEGIDALFPRDKKDRRDGLMLEFLKFQADGTPPQENIGRENWRRLKKQGFTAGEFYTHSLSLASWRQQRKSAASRDNAKKRTVKKSK